MAVGYNADMDTVEQERLAAVLASCLKTYQENDPADSRSGHAVGLGIRKARRRMAVQHLQICLGLDTYDEALAVMETAVR